MNMRLAPRLLVATLVLLMSATALRAQPIFHGLLSVHGGGGPFDTKTGVATLKMRRWDMALGADAYCAPSTGIFPDRESVSVDIGQQSWVLPAGALQSTRHGRVFSYRASGSGLRRLRLVQTGDRTYTLQIEVTGLDLSQLLLNDPGCLPMALIVGDDDFFSDVEFSRRTFTSARFRVTPEACTPGDSWPWAKTTSVCPNTPQSGERRGLIHEG